MDILQTALTLRNGFLRLRPNRFLKPVSRKSENLTVLSITSLSTLPGPNWQIPVQPPSAKNRHGSADTTHLTDFVGTQQIGFAQQSQYRKKSFGGTDFFLKKFKSMR
jgi:hypothetical protein